MNSIRKNRMAQKTEPGKRAKASGYATKAKPGPDRAEKPQLIQLLILWQSAHHVSVYLGGIRSVC